MLLAMTVSVEGPTSRKAASPEHAWIRGFEGGTLHVVFPARATDDEVRVFCDVLEKFWRDVDGPVGTVFDCRPVTAATASQRKLFADLQQRLEPVFRGKMLGAAFLIDSALVRGLLTAIFWLRPPVYRHIVASNEIEARAWLGQLRASFLP